MTHDVRDQLQRALGNNYVVERELPAGGMSRLFLATEKTLERSVVVKLLPPELSSELSAERFRREMLVTARLQHPHILTVLTAGFSGGLLFYVTPYIAGETLRARLAREPRPSTAEAVRILRELADALECAHSAGIVHRDVKPENILLEHGHAVLADFGVARAVSQATLGEQLTGTGLGIGTPGYMAPEQLLNDDRLDGRADLYALGVVGYEMLSGATMFAGESPQRRLAAHLTLSPAALSLVQPELPSELCALVMQLLAKDPSDRPPSAKAVAATLDGIPERSAPRVGGSRRFARAGVAAAAAIALIVVGYLAMHSKEKATVGAAARPAIENASDSAKSVAVLPFVNMSADRDNEYFSDGMTEELIDALAKVNGLHVAARTSSFAFKGRNEDVAAIGAKLHVRSVVEGSVRREGRRLRVTAQLVNVSDGFHVWSETYDRELKDVFQVQDEISRAIARALRIKLQLATHDTVIVRAGTNDQEAHDLYLRGRFLWNQRTYPALLSAQRFFEHAIQRDSSYAEAYAALAQTVILLPVYSTSVRPIDVLPKARAAAAHALALDSTIAAAHSTLGYADILSDYDWHSAATEFHRALALDPNDATAHDWYATYLSAAGRLDDAIVEERRAIALDPLSRSISANVAVEYAIARRYDEALAQLRVTEELDPSFVRSSLIECYLYIVRRDFRVAVEGCEHTLATNGRENGGLGLMALAYAGEGDTAKATAILAELRTMAKRRYVAPTEFAYAYLGLGKHTEAIFWLDSAVSAHDPNMPDYVGDPMLDALREDPRYQRVLARMNIPLEANKP